MSAMYLAHSLEESYQARRTPTWVGPPAGQFLMVDGRGDPNTTPEYAASITALYPLAYGLRFALRKAGTVDAKVLPLEGLWSLADGRHDWTAEDRAQWRWTMMIRVPDPVTPDLLEEVRERAHRKADASARLVDVRLDRYDEGFSAQVLHVGPYSAEGPTIAALHEFIRSAGRTLSGHHHEIYLGDPRRAAPERLRTILRQPVR
jgi:hypothetical protein